MAVEVIFGERFKLSAKKKMRRLPGFRPLNDPIYDFLCGVPKKIKPPLTKPPFPLLIVLEGLKENLARSKNEND